MPRDTRLVVVDHRTGKTVFDGFRPASFIRGRNDEVLLSLLGYDPSQFSLSRGGQPASFGRPISAPYQSPDDQLHFRRPKTGLFLSSEEKYCGRRTALFHPLNGLGDTYDSAVVGAFIRETTRPSHLALYVGRPEVIPLARVFLFQGRPIFDQVLVWDEGSWQRGVALEKPKWDLFLDWRTYVGRAFFKSAEIPVELGTLQEQAYAETFSEATNSLKDLDRTVHELAAESLGLKQVPLDEIKADVPKDDEVRERVRTTLPEQFLTVGNGSDLGHGVRVRQTKEWSIEGWSSSVRELREMTENDIVQVGRAGEERIPGCLSLVGETTIEELLWVLSKSRTHLSVENGTARLARAVGTPGVVLFGPTSSALYALPGNETVQSGVCEPCCWTVPEWTTECPLDIGTVCMKSILPDTVVSAAWRQLSKGIVKNIAVLCGGGLGDDLVRLNLLRQLEPILRKKHPGCHIRYLGRQTYPFLQKVIPFVDEWVTLGTTKTVQDRSPLIVKEHDLTFDLRRSGQVLPKNRLWNGDPLGGVRHERNVAEVLTGSLDDYSFEDDRERLTEHLAKVRASWTERRSLRKRLPSDPFVVIANGTDPTFRQRLTKRIPTSALRAIIRGIHDVGIVTVQVGTPDVYAIDEPGSISLIGETSIEGLIEILRKAHGVVACEGGTAHLAAHLRIPLAVLFGPTDSNYWGYDGVLNLTAENCTCPLRPCEFSEQDWHVRCITGRTDEHGNAECMSAFDEEASVLTRSILDHFGEPGV